MNKTAINLQQALQLEKLLGKETAAKMFHDISRQSGELGKAAIPKFQPRTAIIGPQGVQKVALPPPIPQANPWSKAASAYLKYAHALGTNLAHREFNKWAEGNLGDPNFWQGGTQAAEQTQAQPQDPEQVIGQLPGGSFQGLQTKVTPDGQKSTSLKVTPDALNTPEALAALFQTGQNAKIEIVTPEATPGESLIPAQEPQAIEDVPPPM